MAGHYNTFRQAHDVEASCSDCDEQDVVLSILGDLVHPQGSPKAQRSLSIDPHADARDSGCGQSGCGHLRAVKVLLLVGLSLTVTAAGGGDLSVVSNLLGETNAAEQLPTMPRPIERAIRAHSAQPLQWLEAVHVVNAQVDAVHSFSEAKVSCLLKLSRDRILRQSCRPSRGELVDQAAPTPVQATTAAGPACHDRFYVRHHGAAGRPCALSTLLGWLGTGGAEGAAEGAGGDFEVFHSFADAVFRQKDSEPAASALQPPESFSSYRLYIGMDPDLQRLLADAELNTDKLCGSQDV